jgi:hypothetical protein
MATFCAVKLDEWPVTSISIALADQRRHPGHLTSERSDRSRAPSTERKHCDALIRCSPGVAGVAKVTFSQALGYRHGAAKLTANPITKSKAVSSRYTIQ